MSTSKISLRGFRRLLIATSICLLSAVPSMAQPIHTETASGVIQGDGNFDGRINYADVDAFVLALISVTEYVKKYGVSPLYKFDTYTNGIIDFDDIPGFARLLSPKAPTVPLKLQTKESLIPDAVHTFNYGSDPIASSMSYYGRYIVFKSDSDYDVTITKTIKVFDTFTDNQIHITLPESFSDFQGFDYRHTTIAAGGRYLAAVAFFADESSIRTKVIRYDLLTGKMDLIDEPGNHLYPDISANGQRVAFYTDHGYSPDARRYHSLVKDFARGTLKQLSINKFTFGYKRPSISDDGRFVLAQSSDSLDGQALVSSGWSLYDAHSGALVKQIEPPSANFPSNNYSWKDAVLSYDGRYTAYIKYAPVNGIGKRQQLVVYDRLSDQELALDTGVRYDLTTGLEISHNGQFISYSNKLFNRSNNSINQIKFGSEQTPVDLVTGVSPDGCYISFLYAKAGYHMKNPLKRCYSYQEEDYNYRGLY